MPLTMTTRCSGYLYLASADADAESHTSSPPSTDSTSTFFSFLLFRCLKQPKTTFIDRLSTENSCFCFDLNPNPSLTHTIRLDPQQSWKRPGISAPSFADPSSELLPLMRGGPGRAPEIQARAYQRRISIGDWRQERAKTLDLKSHRSAIPRNREHILILQATEHFLFQKVRAFRRFELVESLLGLGF